MLILLDVGNTAITYGHYSGGRLNGQGSFLHDDIPKIDRKWRKSGAYDKHNDLVISSVVPKSTRKIRKIYGNKTNINTFRILEVDKQIKIPVKHRYRQPKKLGVDRLVNIYGGLRIYGAPFVVIDFGTALTADYVSRKGVFEGGHILPGPEIAFQALITRAAGLPSKSRLPHKAASFLGKTTYDCMASGILEGYGAMTHGLISRFKGRYGEDLKVIVSGGFARHLRPYIHTPIIHDPLLSIKALLLLYKSQGRRA